MKNQNHILIVEDDPQLQSIIQKKLSTAGFETTVCDDGDNAIKMILTKKPDLIVLDVILPHKSGFEILEEIRVKEKLSTPVIVLTNLDQPQDWETGKRLGVTDYFIKSNISLDELVIRINEVFSKGL